MLLNVDDLVDTLVEDVLFAVDKPVRDWEVDDGRIEEELLIKVEDVDSFLLLETLLLMDVVENFDPLDKELLADDVLLADVVDTLKLLEEDFLLEVDDVGFEVAELLAEDVETFELVVLDRTELELEGTRDVPEEVLLKDDVVDCLELMEEERLIEDRVLVLCFEKLELDDSLDEEVVDLTFDIVVDTREVDDVFLEEVINETIFEVLEYDDLELLIEDDLEVLVDTCDSRELEADLLDKIEVVVGSVKLVLEELVDSRRLLEEGVIRTEELGRVEEDITLLDELVETIAT